MSETLHNETILVNQESAKNSPPSGISHGFDTGYAIAYGVEEAIMIRNFQHFITANANRGHNFREGRFWTFDRLEDLPGHFPYWSAKQSRRIIESLIKQGVIIKGSFNEHWSNRTQWYAFKDQEHFIKNIKVPSTPLPVDPVLPKWANGNRPNGQLADAYLGNCSFNTTTTIADTVPNTSLKVPEEPPANAGSGCIASSKKPPKEKENFSSQVQEVAKKMVEFLMKHNPVYRPPGDMTKFLTAVQKMVEDDKQDVATLLKTFEWAAKDNEQRNDFKGWQSIIATNNKGGKATNPAEIFHKYFSKIHSQMGAKVDRKFAPCSNTEAAIEGFRKMKETSI
jgi:hypothetical protein